jgi:predicted enzyme related to lactoylglutathione lyase
VCLARRIASLRRALARTPSTEAATVKGDPMENVTLFKLLVLDQDQALRFYVDQLGFQLAEDKRLGPYRWLLVRAPGDDHLALNLSLAENAEERALVGKQAGQQPLFTIATSDCRRDYQELQRRGVSFEGEPETMPWGTGAMLKDTCGNRIYLSQDSA